MNVVTAGLLDVDVLPRLSGPDRHERVPVIGPGDRDPIDVLVVKNPANVLHSGRYAAAVGLDLMDAIVKGPGVGIDQISDGHRGHLHVLIDMRPAPAVEPGDRDPDRIIRTDDPSRRPRSPDGKPRAGHGHRSIQELATTQIALRHGAGPFPRNENTLRIGIARAAILTSEG